MINKPIFEKICAPAWIYSQKILPAAIDDSMSYYEFCCKLLAYINKLIDANKQLQDAIDDLYDFVNNVLNEIISRLPDIVKDQLEQWRDDGTLAELINDILFQSKEDKLFPKSENLTVNRVFRDITIYDNKAMNYATNQGMGYTENGKFVVAYIPAGSTIRPTTDNVRLVEYSIPGDQIVRSGIFPFMHGNSIAFNPDRRELYVAYCYKAMEGGGQQSQNKIGIVDYDTWTQKGVFELSHNSCGVTYDRVTKKLYCFGSQNDFWEYTITSDGILQNTNHIFCEPGSIGTVGQSSEVYTYTDGKGQQQTLFFRATYSPNTITVYNYSGKIVKVFNPPYYGNGIYKLGELEDISHVEGSKFYISTYSPLNNSGTMTMMQLFELDFTKNVAMNPWGNLATNVNDIGGAVRVSNTQTSFKCTGTASNPVRYLQEALNIAESGFYPGIDIYFASPGDYEPARANKIYSPLRLINETSGTVRVKGLNCYNCHDIYINNINFGGGVYPGGNASLDFYMCQGAVYNSTVEKGPSYGMVVDGWSDIWVSSLKTPGDITDFFVNSGKLKTSNTQWHDNVTIGNTSGKTEPNIVRLYNNPNGINTGSVKLSQSVSNFSQLMFILFNASTTIRLFTNNSINGRYTFNSSNIGDDDSDVSVYEMLIDITSENTINIEHTKMYRIKGDSFSVPNPSTFGIIDICGIT